MTLSTAQLDADFTNVNEGQAPDAATQLLLAAYAQQTIGGTITDAAALNLALHIPPPADGSVGSNTPESTTDVALGIYQFFTGMAPTLDGLDFLVNNDGGAPLNPNDLDSAFYAGFNQANRYYNFAINLITGNAGVAASFAASYGSVTFNQAVVASYESIVGTPNVGAAAAAAAEAAIEAKLPYFQAVASEIAPGVNQDLATKAIMIAYILEEAVKADVGYYAFAIDAFNTLLAANPEAGIPGMTPNGVDLLTSFPMNPVGVTIVLTPTIDDITPPATNNNTVVANELTLNSLDNINLGTTTGNELNWVETTNHDALIVAVPPFVSVSGVQTANFVATDPLIVNTTGWGGLNTLNVLTISGDEGATNVTADPTTVVNLTDQLTEDNGTGNDLTVNGGSVVTITEANGKFFSAGEGIQVNGGPGTTSVTVNQTWSPGGSAQNVEIEDYFATIANVTLNGLSANFVTINDNNFPGAVGLTNLSVSNVTDFAVVHINDPLGAPSTLNLAVSNAHFLDVNDEFSAYGALNVTAGANTLHNDGFAYTAYVYPIMGGVTKETVTGTGTIWQDSFELNSLQSIAIIGGAGFIDTGLGSNVETKNVPHLALVDASASTGLIFVTLDSDVTSFVGGAGQDVVTINEDAGMSIAGGTTGLNVNEIILSAPGGAFGVSTSANVSGFEILGTDGNSSGTYNLGFQSSSPAIADIEVRANPAGALTFTDAQPNQTLSIDATLDPGITLIQGAAAAASGSDVLTLNLGLSADSLGLDATDGIDTSNAAAGVPHLVGVVHTTPAHAGAITVSSMFTLGGGLTAWKDVVSINTDGLSAGDKVQVTLSPGDTINVLMPDNVATDDAKAIVAAINADAGDAAKVTAAFTSTIDGTHATFTVTSNTLGAAGNESLTVKDLTSVNTGFSGTVTNGTNAISSGSIIVLTSEPGASELGITTTNGAPLTVPFWIGADVPSGQTVNQIASLIGTDIAGIGGIGGVVVVGNKVTFTDTFNDGPLVVTNEVAQVSTIDLTGVKVVAGDVFTEKFTDANGAAQSVAYTAIGGDNAAAVAGHLATLINGVGGTELVASASGDIITVTTAGVGGTDVVSFGGTVTDAEDSFTVKQVVETTFGVVGSQAIKADGYETVNLNSLGTNASGTGFNSTLLMDNALTSLFVAGPESLIIDTGGGHGLTNIDTTGSSPFAFVNLTGVLPSETTTGIFANLGNANVQNGTGGVGLIGNAGAGFVDTITGGNGSDNIEGTHNGGTTVVALGDGPDVVTISGGTGNSVTLGNGAGDVVKDTSHGTDSIFVGDGDGVVVIGGNGNYSIQVGNGQGDHVTVGDGSDVISVGSGLSDKVVFGDGQDMVTFGTHSSSITLFDIADLTALTTPSFATPTTTSQVSILAGGLDTIAGLAPGDHIILPANDVIVVAANLAGHNNDVVFTTGTLSGGVFSEGAGPDALMTYDNGTHHFVSVVLIGGAGEVGSVTHSAGDLLIF